MTEPNLLTMDTYDSDKLTVGTLVSQEVIDHFRNQLLPVLDWHCHVQLGGAVCDRIVDNGKLRPAYATFRRRYGQVWEYRGACLHGEFTERGEIPACEKIN